MRVDDWYQAMESEKSLHGIFGLGLLPFRIRRNVISFIYTQLSTGLGARYIIP